MRIVLSPWPGAFVLLCFLFFSIQRRNWLYYLERGIPWKKKKNPTKRDLLTKHAHNVLLLWSQEKQTVSLVRNLQLFSKLYPWSSVCLSPYTGMPPTSSLRYSRDKWPCLYLGLQSSVDLRIGCYHLLEQLCLYQGRTEFYTWSKTFLLSFVFDSLDCV